MNIKEEYEKAVVESGLAKADLAISAKALTDAQAALGLATASIKELKDENATFVAENEKLTKEVADNKASIDTKDGEIKDLTDNMDTKAQELATSMVGSAGTSAKSTDDSGKIETLSQEDADQAAWDAETLAFLRK